MKKYLLLALLVLSTSAFATNLTVFGGENVNQDFGVSYFDYYGSNGSGTLDTDNSYFIGIEINKSILKKGNNNLEVGMGTEYTSVNLPDGDVEYNKNWASFIPVYGDIKYSYKLNGNTSIFLKGKAGYVFCNEGKYIDDWENEEIVDFHLNGELYTGIGMGVEYKKLSTSISYDTIKYNMTVDEESDFKWEIKHDRVSLALGYKFGK